MEWKCWRKLLFVFVFILTLNGNVISQNIDHIYISDSIACDTFPPPRNLDGYTQDFAIKVWWEVPLLPDTSKFYFQERSKQHSSINRNVRTINVTDHDSKDMWDIQALFPCGGQGGEYGVETDGNYIWTSKANGGNGTFFQYELDGTFNGPVIVPGCQDVRDMAYNNHDELIYGSNCGNIIWGIDFETLTVVNTISTSYPCRAIAYDPENIAFWCNDWNTDICLIDMAGMLISSFPLPGSKSISGLAYDDSDYSNPCLWGFSAEGGGAELIQMDINSGGTQIFSIDITPIVGGTNAPGGLYTHCALYEDYTLTIGGIRQDEIIFGLELGWCPGIVNPIFFTPDNLLGYNLYRNDDFLNYIEYDGDDTTSYWDFEFPYPDMYCYTVTALYDLDACGLPGDTGESVHEGPKCFSMDWSFILPFVENWTTGSFDPNLWTADEYWTISGQSGNPMPTALFTGQLLDTNYSRGITSFWINCRDHPGTMDPYIDGDFWLEFDIKLDDNTMSGNELLTVQLSDSIEWETIHEFSNSSGSFDWQFNKIDITGQAKGHIIRIAFVAEGENAIDINSWYIDNIMVYRQCNPPLDLHWLIFDESMAWSPPLPHTSDQSDISRELLGYKVYEITQFLDFTTDTFYVLDQSYGYGPYYVTAVYEDCEPASNPIYGPTGIDENITNTEINIFPNPTKDRISIRSDKIITRIQLIKSDGVLLFDRNFQNSLVSLPLDNYPAGIYLVKIYHDNAVISRKVLLKK